MKPIYTNISHDGTDNLHPLDGAWQAVRVEHPLAALPIFVTAHRSPNKMTHEEATKWAESLTINGWSWRLPTAEEAFLICDRTRPDNVLPPENFPDCQGEAIWSSTPVAWRSGAAWGVDLGNGYSGWGYRGDRYLARAVRAGQF